MKFRTFASAVGFGAVTCLGSFAMAQDTNEVPTSPPAESEKTTTSGEEKPVGDAKTDATAKPADGPQTAVNEDGLTEEQKKAYEGHLRAGKVAYGSSDFENAFKELDAAYKIFPKPSILFNIALISEKGGALERAAEVYQTYLSAPGVSLNNRKRASDRLKAVQEILAATTESERATAQQNVTDLLPALEAMGIENVPNATLTANTTTQTQTTTKKDNAVDTKSDIVLEPSRPDVDYSWPVYVSLGAATAALAGGVVMVAMTNKEIEDGRQSGRDGDIPGLEASEDQASIYATTAAGLFAGGALFAIVGSYFAIADSIDAENEGVSTPSASLSFSLQKSFIGPILIGEF